MKPWRHARLTCVAGLSFALAGCGVAAPPGAASPWSTPAATQADASPSAPPTPGATGTSSFAAAFAHISDAPLPDDRAAELQEILATMGAGAGLTATVMSRDGTWSGATGTADGVRTVTVDDQFAIASITKAIAAAQVMQLVEAGALSLDDPVADHLPPAIELDTSGATIRQLLAQRSGIPDLDWSRLDPLVRSDPTRDWAPGEVLEFVPADRNPAGAAFDYTNTNYVLLGLVIERVGGGSVADVMRDGVLGIDGVERLIYQPDEAPSAPMAMPDGGSAEILAAGGGLLPSRAFATADRTAAAMASDSRSLGRWWRAFCAGRIVSEASLTEMRTMDDGYGLGLYEPDPPGTVGHGGEHVGYTSLAGCRPDDGIVFVLLVNRSGFDLSPIAQRLVDAMRSP